MQTCQPSGSYLGDSPCWAIKIGLDFGKTLDFCITVSGNIITSDFIGDFKLGDNIVYNLKCLDTLYECQKSEIGDRKDYLRKSIIVLISSIAEAVLFDFYRRMKTFTREGVDNVEEGVLEDVRSKRIDQFAKYIDYAKSQNFFGSGSGMYENLHDLRKLRNRIHIQNDKKQFEADEADVFTETQQLLAERTMEELMRMLSNEYSRAKNTGHVEPFVLPWLPHFPSVS